MPMMITKEGARYAVAALDQEGTPEAAAHYVEVGLTAIRPYSDWRSEDARRALLWATAVEGDRREKRVAAIRALAAQGAR